MDKQSKLIFENYAKSLLNEAPVEMGDYAGTGEEIKPTFPEMSRGKYDLTPDETESVYGKFLSQFREKGGKSPKLFKDFFETEIAPIVREVKPSINNTNSKYTARVLYTALKAAGVLKDERDGIEGISLKKRISAEGVKKLTKFTLSKAGELGVEDKTESGSGIDDIVMKRFWDKILGEGEYTKDELMRMMVEDNPDMEESEARINISSLIRTGYLEKQGGGYIAVDPEEKQSEREEKEGEGSGEITTGFDPSEVDDIDSDPYGGVYVGPTRGSGGMD
jgi:hypothetical protein